MRYFVRVGGVEHQVTVTPDGVELDGEQVKVDLRSGREAGTFQLREGFRIYHVVAGERELGERGGIGRTLWVDGVRVPTEVVDERRKLALEVARAAGARSGPVRLIAPMPGMVVRVSVAVGDSVESGQGLVVMEAMKMENELRSPGSGTVRMVHAAAGSAVEKGAVLVELE